jgi:sugar O-acyltransferase (sialic acid O-acetyltransferase NeuD family)
MILYGRSSLAKVIIGSAVAEGRDVSGLFDDNPDVKELLVYKVIGPFDFELAESEELIISVGDNGIRKKIVESLPDDVLYGLVRHPSAVISEYAYLGDGTVVMQGAVVQSCARIGNHCIINTAASVDHDCVIEDYVHISPNATLCGAVTVGEGSQVGAGAVVMKNVPDNVLVLGNPARVIKRLKYPSAPQRVLKKCIQRVNYHFPFSPYLHPTDKLTTT